MLEIVGTTQVFTARLEKRISIDSDAKYTMLLFAIYIDGDRPFRNHTFVQSSHRWNSVKEGDNVTFTALVIQYESKGNRQYGLDKVRNIHITMRGDMLCPKV